jgi:hypothetical protein
MTSVYGGFREQAKAQHITPASVTFPCSVARFSKCQGARTEHGWEDCDFLEKRQTTSGIETCVFGRLE